MKIGIIGTGYVGLVTGACFAEKGHKVICVDNDKKKIDSLKKGVSPIYEIGLEDIIKKNTKKGNLSFTTNLDDAVKNSSVLFIAVGTPPCADGSVDLTHVWDIAKEIGKSMDSYKVVVNKSTVPVGTAKKVREIILNNSKSKYVDVVSNPEFLREGRAVEDFMKPDRVVLGTKSETAMKIMHEVYKDFVSPQNPIVFTDNKSAEIIKYASNVFLATKISLINEFANLCDKVGANIDDVSMGVGLDKRIGKHFLSAGMGYGGSCFPKDVKGLIYTAKKLGLELKIAKAVEAVNKGQKKVLASKLKEYFNTYHKGLNGKKVALWGLAFKAGTDDIRESPAIVLIKDLIKEGVSFRVYDPKAMDNAKKVLKNKVDYADSAMDALKDCEVLVVATDWDEFKNPDFWKVREILKRPVIFDGKNMYSKKEMTKYSIAYEGIGK